MKHQKFKRTARALHPKPYNLLSEIHPNTLASRNCTKNRYAQIKRKRRGPICNIPEELIFYIFEFLHPRYLISHIQLVSREWNCIVNDTRLWSLIQADVGLELRWNVCKNSCLVERRSKGKLYTGYLRTTRQPVILRKVFLDVTNAGQDDGLPTSILREVAYMSSFSHPNIADFHGAQVHENVAYVCVEQGRFNLKDYLMKFNREEVRKPAHQYMTLVEKRQRYSVPLDVVKTLMHQLFTGLNYLHHNGVIHRNLKSDNIIVQANGQVRITDFALSRMTSIPHGTYTPEDPKERDRSGREARRLWYRAPEFLFRKEQYSFEVDIWSVGCLMAEICLNEPLFNGDTEIDQLFKIFKFIGTPSAELFPNYQFVFPQWKQINFSAITQPKNSPEFRQISKDLIPSRETVLQKLTQLGSLLGARGMDLLQQCLEIDPNKRITAAQALQHPFFQPIEQIPCCAFQYYNAASYPECHLLQLTRNMRQLEVNPRRDPAYLNWQDSITESMRAILVDWLIDVSVHFELQDETLHIGIRLIDQVLSIEKTNRTKLQLLGVTCIKIADVFNEKSKEYYRQENASEYAYITADEYTPQEVIETEKRILNLLEFKVITPNIMQFLKAYCHFTDVNTQAMTLAMYMADVLLLSYDALKYPPSLLASAVLFLSMHYYNMNLEPGILERCRREFGWSTLEDFTKCVNFVREFWLLFRSNVQYSRFEAVNNKYEGRYALPVSMIVPNGVTPYALSNWWYMSGQSIQSYKKFLFYL